MIVLYFVITRNDLDERTKWWNASKQHILKRRDSIVWVMITQIVCCIVKYKILLNIYPCNSEQY